ncbi:winged helix-turn-helix domain-containing protein [Streptomyces atratus]
MPEPPCASPQGARSTSSPPGCAPFLARPRPSKTPGTVDLGPYTVDLTDCTITRRPDAPPGPRTGHSVHLTPTESRLLHMLLRSPERLVVGEALLREVWGDEHRKDSHYLRVYMATLRQKLEADPAHPQHLITEPGLGYRFRR